MEQEFRVVVEYKSVRKALVVAKLNTQRLEPLVQQLFSLEIPFQVVLKSLNALVISTNEVFPNDELEVQILPANDNISESESKNSENIPSGVEQLLVETNVEELKDKDFLGSSLLEELNAWASQKNFSLYFPNGSKPRKDGVRRTVQCNYTGCKFKLYFLSLSNVKTEEQEGNAAKELKFKLESFKNEHNHEIKEKRIDQFTHEIIKEIDSNKGRMKTIADIKDYINEKFNSNFSYVQIQYQVKKLIEENFGRPEDDATLLIEEFEKDKKNGGKYEADYTPLPEKRLRRVLYVSSTMLNYVNKFLDIVIVDATYKRNRFNMPLINIIGVNNYGRTILLGFGLMDDEKMDSYDWFFKNLKKNME